MQRLYLALSVLGFMAPNVFVMKVSMETGNWLFYMDPMATIDGMFANDIATAFIIDLMMAVTVFFAWSYHEARKHHMPRVWMYWILTMLFGIAGPFPLFLYMREKEMAKAG